MLDRRVGLIRFGVLDGGNGRFLTSICLGGGGEATDDGFEPAAKILLTQTIFNHLHTSHKLVSTHFPKTTGWFPYHNLLSEKLDICFGGKMRLRCVVDQFVCVCASYVHIPAVLFALSAVHC